VFCCNIRGVIICNVLPDNGADEIVLAKGLVTNLAKIRLLVAVDGDENNAVFPQEVLRQSESGIHEAQPIRVATPICLGARSHSVSLVVLLVRTSKIGLRVLCKRVLVNYVGVLVVRRIDVNHLHLAQVRFQQFVDFALGEQAVQFGLFGEIKHFSEARQPTLYCDG